MYDNPLWDVEKEGDACFQMVTSSLSVPILDIVLDRILESNSDLTYEDTLNEVILCDTFFYYLYAYNDASTCVEGISFVGRESNEVLGCFLGQDEWLCFPFDLGDTLKVCEFVTAPSWTNQIFSASRGSLFFMRIVDSWLYHKFVHSWHVGILVNSYANPPAMRSLWFFLSSFWSCKGVDSRTNLFSRKGE